MTKEITVRAKAYENEEGNLIKKCNADFDNDTAAIAYAAEFVKGLKAENAILIIFDINDDLRFEIDTDKVEDAVEKIEVLKSAYAENETATVIEESTGAKFEVVVKGFEGKAIMFQISETSKIVEGDAAAINYAISAINEKANEVRVVVYDENVNFVKLIKGTPEEVANTLEIMGSAYANEETAAVIEESTGDNVDVESEEVDASEYAVTEEAQDEAIKGEIENAARAAIAEENMGAKFEVGKVYINGTVIRVTVISRTAKFVTVQHNAGKHRCKINTNENGVETIAMPYVESKIKLPYSADSFLMEDTDASDYEVEVEMVKELHRQLVEGDEAAKELLADGTIKPDIMKYNFEEGVDGGAALNFGEWDCYDVVGLKAAYRIIKRAGLNRGEYILQDDRAFHSITVYRPAIIKMCKTYGVEYKGIKSVDEYDAMVETAAVVDVVMVDYEDDGSNDDPDEDSVLDELSSYDENEDDDELIDEPEIENTGAKFEVGKVYVLHDICYTVTKRTEKFVTFKHQTAQSAVLDYYKEVVTRKAIEFDDDGNEVVYGLSAFGRLESTVDLATYEKLFGCKLNSDGKFVSYNWNDENTVDVEFDNVVVESEVDAGEYAARAAIVEETAAVVEEVPQVEFALERFTDFDLVAEINSIQVSICDALKKIDELRERRRQLLELEFGTDYCKSRPCSGSKPLFEYVDAILTPLVFEQNCPTKFISQDGKIWDMAKTGYVTIIEPRSAKPLTVDKLKDDDTHYCYVMRGFSTPSATYCEYSTLRQFKEVIRELAAAIKRGEKQFRFPADNMAIERDN